MRRREFITLVSSAAACSPATLAEQPSMRGKPFRIATLPDFVPASRDPFLAAMGDLGLREGRDFLLEKTGVQYGDGILSEAAQRVAEAMPDLIVVPTTAYAIGAYRATKTIPIVMLSSGYPVEAGLANSLARPGRNVTGNSIYAGTEVWAKLVQLLLEAKPSTRRISVLWSYVPPLFAMEEEIEPCYAELRNAERVLGVKVHIIEIAKSDQVPAALAQIETEQADALLLTSGIPYNVRSAITQFAVDKRLPAITDLLLPAAESATHQVWPPS